MTRTNSKHFLRFAFRSVLLGVFVSLRFRASALFASRFVFFIFYSLEIEIKKITDQVCVGTTLSDSECRLGKLSQIKAI